MGAIKIDAPRSMGSGFVALNSAYKTVASAKTPEALQLLLKRMGYDLSSVRFMFIPKPGINYVYA